MKRISYTLLALMVTLGISSHAQEKKIEFTEYDLDNGLHVILHKNDKTPIVANDLESIFLTSPDAILIKE